MATVFSLLNKVKAVNELQVGQEAMLKCTNQLTEENKKQLHAGYNRAGFKIGDIKPYANAHYAFFKANKNALPGLGNPDLELTGAFKNRIATTMSGDVIMTKSTDSKAAKLEMKYPYVMGLGGQFKVEFVEETYQPAYVKTARSKLSL